MENPYQAPKSEGKIFHLGDEERSDKHLCQDGGHVVSKKNVTWPDRCVVCNAPAKGYVLHRKLSWHHPNYFLLFFLTTPIVYAIVALIVRQTAVLRVGLCETHRARRKLYIIVSWTGIALSLGVMALSLILDSRPAVICFLAGGAGAIVFAAAGAMLARVISTVRMNDEWVWVNTGTPFWKSLA